MKLSIVIPSRNEEDFIGKCLDSILASDYPKDEIEVLIADGLSTDNTRNIVRQYSGRYPFIKLFDNHKKVTSTALNIGVENAQGEYILILSSHSKVGRNFIRRNIEAFQEYDTDCVGGIIITLPSRETSIARSIATALSHPFGVGNAYFRIGTEKPRHVDTVPFGCYKREVFRKNGLFDEDLIRNQDDEFNFRLIKNGYKILLVPEIISYYYARDKILNLWNMYFQYGYFKPLVVHKVGGVLTWRQLIPASFIISIIFSGILSFVSKQFLWLFFIISGSYLLTSIYISFSIALKKGFKYLFVLPAVFCTIHASYGWGYSKGIWDFLVSKKHMRKKIKDVPLTR